MPANQTLIDLIALTNQKRQSLAARLYEQAAIQSGSEDDIAFNVEYKPISVGLKMLI